MMELDVLEKKRVNGCLPTHPVQLSSALGWVSTRYAWVYVAVTSTVWLPVCPLV